MSQGEAYKLVNVMINLERSGVFEPDELAVLTAARQNLQAACRATSAEIIHQRMLEAENILESWSAKTLEGTPWANE